MDKEVKAVPVEKTGLEFEYDDETMTVKVIGVEDEYITEVKIPSQVECDGNVYDVTEIGFFSFSECITITSIEIPESVTYIGGWEFWRCKNLKTAKVPASLKGKVESEFPTTCEIEFY